MNYIVEMEKTMDKQRRCILELEKRIENAVSILADMHDEDAGCSFTLDIDAEDRDVGCMSCLAQLALNGPAEQPAPRGVSGKMKGLDTVMAELCARLREHFEASGHPTCPDPECDYAAYENTEHAPDCAYAKYAEAQDAAINTTA